MSARPTSVTVISWILIVLAVLSLVTTTLMMENPQAQELMRKSPVPLSVQYALSYVNLAILLVCGIAMLKGRNWGRWLYVAGSAVGLLVGVVTSPVKAALIPGVVIFAVVTFFLFRPKANRYFARAAPAQ